MVAPLIAAALPIVGELLDRFIPDTAARDKAKAEAEMRLLEIAQQGQMAQVEVNKIEASHGSLFVSGARPFILWICGVAFAYHYLLQPFLAFTISNYTGKMVLLPAIDMEVIGYTLTGMLGIGGGMRTFEKIKGVAK